MRNQIVEQPPNDLDLDTVFQALVHPISRDILEQLAGGSERVSDLGDHPENEKQ